MKLTTEDIANEAGVSRATVSRVLNGHGGVRHETVIRINKAMDRLGYVRPALRPGPRPRNMTPQQQSLKSVGLVLLGGAGGMFTEPTMAYLIEDLQRVCRARRINLVLEQTSDPHELPHCVGSGQVEGVILMPFGLAVGAQRDALRLLSARIPCVHVFGPSHPFPLMDHVTVNDVAVGALAYKELVERGCDSFVLVDGSNCFHEAQVVRGRAFLDRCLLAKHPSAVISASHTEFAKEGLWPGNVHVMDSHEAAVRVCAKLKSKGAVGYFFSLDKDAGAFYRALSEAGLFDDGRGEMVVAGVTPAYVDSLQPRPILVDTCLGEVLEGALSRLVVRIGQMNERSVTTLIAPRVLDESD
ncbi:LacI family DNA-binding transcriptional regulator [Coraliomargarita sp. SDUM461004]|uniref:LacI family DNA-binding transcriptional regulator n=1 Tax=Thalassobacterium sedimentorum TaxID=3041258 RepID=A0ABU1AFQ9_9BACT|nr:LacI family DNA-binding transcriptional regulator [Coraliomargarita sp. SDUM461004]MDQ8192963.1 LacI family DNA-binding transcriptional regulator [Coraliomargarita sp. SDUM461004]